MQDVWTLALHDLHVEKDAGNPEVWRRRQASAHTPQLTGTRLVCYLQKGLRFWRNKGAVLRNWDGLLVLKLCSWGRKCWLPYN